MADSEPTLVPGPKEETSPVSRTVIAGEGCAPSATPQPPPEGKPFGRYRLLSSLGQGGMGIVWKAWDTDLRRLVAIKGILSFGDADQTRVTRFQREAQSAAKLRHPNIVSVHDVGVIDGQHFICADLIDGASLDKRLGDPLPVRKALELTRTIALALQYAHDQGIVHRDVKPGNILLDAAETPYVTDFGLAKDVRTSEAPTITGSGDLLGTPAYMSPEQARGEAKHIGPASDQFALGVLLFEMLTGKRPFVGETQLDLMRAITEAEAPRPTSIQPRIHRDVETICLKALEKDPSRRYARVADLAADITRYLDGEPILATPVSAAERLWRKAYKYRAILIPTVAALLLGGGWALRARHGESEARAKQEAAERQLDKSRKVADVFGRWGQLSGAIREIERARLSQGPVRDRRATLDLRWKDIEAFLAQTPEDTASRATARALAAWARCMVTDLREGQAWAKEAAEIDPEVPFGHLMQALMVFAWEVEHQPFPEATFTELGYVVGEVPPGTPDLASARDEVSQLIAEAERRPVWGREGASAFRSAANGLAAYGRGDYAGSDGAFGVALAAPDLASFQGGFLFARAKARFLRRAYREGIEDVERLEEAYPEDPTSRLLHGHLLEAIASEEANQGKDPRPTLRKAISAFEEAVGLAPAGKHERSSRGMGWMQLAQADYDRGTDPLPSVDKAIAEFDAVSEAEPSDASALTSRGKAWSWRGWALDRAGKDPFQDLEKAIADFDRALRLSPGLRLALQGRGSALQHRAEAEATRGKDPRGSLIAAIADFKAMLDARPDDPGALMDRGIASMTLGIQEEARGGDPTDRYAQARADLQRTVELLPTSSKARLNLAILCRKRALAEASRGGDPRPLMDEGIDWLTQALAVCKDDADLLAQRGIALGRRAEAESERGGDPFELFDRAIADFDAAQKANPAVGRSRIDCGNCWFHRAVAEQKRGIEPAGSLGRAIEAYGSAIKIKGGDPDGWAGRGCAEATMGDLVGRRGEDSAPWIDRAVADYGEAIARNPRWPDYYNNRGCAWLSRATMDAEIGKDPRDPLRKAISDLDQAILTRPNSTAYRLNRAKCWIEVGSAEEIRGEDPLPSLSKATEDLDASIGVNPHDAGLYRLRSAARVRVAEAELARSHDPSATLGRALEDAERAVREDPSDLQSLRQRGMVFAEMGKALAARGEDPTARIDAAIAEFDGILTQAPGFLDAKWSRGEALVQRARVEKRAGRDPAPWIRRAIRDDDDVLAIHARLWRVWENKGLAHEDLGELDAAVAAFERAHALVGDACPEMNEALARTRAALQPKESEK